MTELHVSLDSSRLQPVERKLQEPLEEQLTSALKRGAEVVAGEYAGQSEEEVAQWILREARSALHPDIAEGFRPSDADLRAVAQAVIRGDTFE